MKQRILTIGLAVLCFIAALGIILYPAVSSYVNEKYRSEIQTEYELILQQVDTSELDRIRELAVEYNTAITPGTTQMEAFSQEAMLAASEDYRHQLDPVGTGIMGYVEVPSLNIYLPIYHGTETDSLERGVGHLLGSSLPVGGSSTHTILTGHSGMASQRLFTDLPQMQAGDVFYLHILDEVLAYQVDQMETVLPYDTTHLGVASGEDYCTLITCTPIGINTQRLLVRGKRIPYEAAVAVQEEVQAQQEEPGSNWQDQYLLGIWLGILGTVLMALIAWLRVWIPKWIRRSWRGKYVR